MTPSRGRLLSVRLAALYLGLGYSALRNAIARKELTVLRHGSGRLAGIYVSELDAWVGRRCQPATVPHAREVLSVDERMQALMPPKHERMFSH